jgi:hypothetical protein
VQPISGLQELPLQFGEVDELANIRWGMPVVIPVRNRTAFEFYDFFDWSPCGMIDLPYVRVRVRNLPRIANAQGSLALIEQQYCRFLFVK